MERKLPIGVQDFRGLINDGYIYVDKTKYIYELAHTGKYYFLSRPRRFGKSLFLSTLMEYWLGNREIFSGLDIERLEKNNPDAWKRYPIFYFDFGRAGYTKEGILEGILKQHLEEWEQLYNVKCTSEILSIRFQNVLKEANTQSGLGCVILVDEYDKPLLDTIDNPELNDHNRTVFNNFFLTLKSYDRYIKFTFIAGVTKFSKVSIFSDLNQLDDISMEKAYCGICGITETELLNNFSSEIKALSDANGITAEESKLKLKKTYDGYHFTEEAEGVYNPFSLLKAMKTKEFGYYWFETGTPTFLVKMLKNIEYDIRALVEKGIYASKSAISNYRQESTNPIPLLYQAGYLTITDYDSRRERYTLGFPNEEVKYGMLDSLLPEYVPIIDSRTGVNIFRLDDLVENGDTDGLRDFFISIFAGLSYTSNEAVFEHYFQTVIYLLFTLIGKIVKNEMRTYKGRIDCVVETSGYIYLFEFKVDSSADEALKQIDSKDYALPYKADGRKLYKIGVNFSSKTRMLEDWKVI